MSKYKDKCHYSWRWFLTYMPFASINFLVSRVKIDILTKQVYIDGILGHYLIEINKIAKDGMDFVTLTSFNTQDKPISSMSFKNVTFKKYEIDFDATKDTGTSFSLEGVFETFEMNNLSEIDNLSEIVDTIVDPFSI